MLKIRKAIPSIDQQATIQSTNEHMGKGVDWKRKTQLVIKIIILRNVTVNRPASDHPEDQWTYEGKEGMKREKHN